MPADGDEITLILRSEVDVFRARKEAQRLADELGLGAIDTVKVTTSVSEIASNAVAHAGAATISLRMLHTGTRMGLMVVTVDTGPGILDLDAALRDGYSTRGSLGIGMGAAKRLMDEFDVVTEIGKGTTVTMTKWKS